MFRSDRRSFLGTATVAGAAWTLGSAVHSDEPKNTKTLKMGIIGVGGYGMADAKAALKVGGVDIVERQWHTMATPKPPMFGVTTRLAPESTVALPSHAIATQQGGLDQQLSARWRLDPTIG